MFGYCERLLNILEISAMLTAKLIVFKDNPNFVSSLIYFVPIRLI